MTYSLADFARFAEKLRTETGTPFELAPFQKRLLKAYFRGVRETVIVLPTGNGKTTLLAALGLYHMLRVKNASVVIVASAAEQASQLFKQMRTLIDDTPYAELLDVNLGTYRIFHRAPSLRGRSSPRLRPGGEIRVIASEVKKQEGLIPTLVLVDEYHAHDDDRMYQMLRDKLRKRQHEKGCGRMVTISTAGFSLHSPLYELKERVGELPSFTRKGFYNHAAEPNFEWHEYCLTDANDPDDVTRVARMNPASWVTKEVLEDARASPSMSAGEWARSACNLWTSDLEQAIRPEEWDALRADGPWAMPEGTEVVLAPSVGHNAAIGVASMRPDGKVAVTAEVLEPREGHSIRIDTEKRIVQLCDEFDVVSVQHPVGAFLRMADALALEGVPLEEAPHSPQRLAAATGEFDKLRRAGQLIHDGDPILRQHVLAGQLKTTETGERYMISDRARALIAVIMAVYGATAVDPEPFVLLPSGVG